MDNLTNWELKTLLSLCIQHWMPEDRQRIARTLPQVYAKLFDVSVTVDTGSNTLVIQGK